MDIKNNTNLTDNIINKIRFLEIQNLKTNERDNVAMAKAICAIISNSYKTYKAKNNS